MGPEDVRVFLGLGSNLGDRPAHLANALRFLSSDPAIRIGRVSSVYQTVPISQLPQPRFLNAVAEIFTRLEPRALLERLKEHERRAGRTASERWGPRPIDLDILVYGDLEVDEADLRIPHTELRYRAFVLVPLAELEPALRLPGDLLTVEAWRDGRPDLAGVVRIGPPLALPIARDGAD